MHEISSLHAAGADRSQDSATPLSRAGVSTRRDLLRMACGCAAAASLPGGAAIGAKRASGWIDVHHHHGTPELIRFLASHRSNRQLPPINWTVSGALEDMDRSGVETAILSQFAPYHLGTREARAVLARSLNESGARFAKDHPGRFGLFATLPLPSIDDCLAEIAHGLDVLGADGIAMVTSANGKWLGDPFFDPIHAELNRRKAVVYVHPWTSDCCVGLVPEIPEYVIEYGTDTSRAIGSLIWSGTTTRYPDIKFIFSHGGGTVPFLIERFLAGTQAEIVKGIVTKGVSTTFVPKQPPGGPLAELRRMFFDTAQVANPVALDALRKVVPVSQILYGSDYWYRTNAETVEGVLSSRVFSGAEIDLIGKKNMLGLLQHKPGSNIRLPVAGAAPAGSGAGS